MGGMASGDNLLDDEAGPTQAEFDSRRLGTYDGCAWITTRAESDKPEYGMDIFVAIVAFPIIAAIIGTLIWIFGPDEAWLRSHNLNEPLFAEMILRSLLVMSVIGAFLSVVTVFGIQYHYWWARLARPSTRLDADAWNRNDRLRQHCVKPQTGQELTTLLDAAEALDLRQRSWEAPANLVESYTRAWVQGNGEDLPGLPAFRTWLEQASKSQDN